MSTRNPWDAMLDVAEGSEQPTQAGQIEPGLEEGHGGDKGLDAETGSGGYSGDAVEAGYQESVGQPDKPLDVEIHGDPRTHQDEGYPNEAMISDADQKPVGESFEDDVEYD